MKTAFTQLNATLTKQLKNCYLIWGTEELLFDNAIKAFNKHMETGKEDPMNTYHFNLKDTPIEDVIHEAESLPFFGDQKLIIVHDSFIFSGKKVSSSITHNIDLLERYLNDPSDFSTLVFLAPYDKLDKRKKITKSILKKAEVIEANPAKESEIRNYLQSYFSEKGFSIAPEAMNLLLQLTDHNLTRSIKEAEKLAIYHNGQQAITIDAISKLVSKSLEQNIFDLNERVLNKNVKESIELYQDLITQKEDPIKILALMISQFRLLLQVKILKKKGYQQSDIAAILKVHPFRVKLAVQKEQKFPQEILSKAHHLLITADHDIKTGKVDPELQIELFIWQFCTL
ncbi:DNA polymerase III subunit delta [Alkalibacterium olivapovliticus]|uniref:DNA polymerase III subunit delta n=1 Tax=Alkalibacterium olivapovliticus TaxID=99907 RepID=A0A2T0WBH3_9LACT|nr:DNA polymerase III subunit delta [Alkalibacterium olivapovliticus]PRY83874.1 DNA polymerase III delta subunit [Alkalibacterium olivapovliticus]